MSLKSPVTGTDWAFGQARRSSGSGSGIGSGSSGSGGSGSGSGGSPSSPERRCQRAGIDIERIVHPDSTADIDNHDNTLYIIDGTLDWGGPMRVDHIRDVALVGTNNARIPLPEGSDDAVFRADSARSFMLANIDLDQRADRARASLDLPFEDKGIVENVHTKGLAVDPDEDPNHPLPNVRKRGPFLYPAATTDDTRVTVRNVSSVNGGPYPVRHWGDRQSGIWLGPDHRGRLDIVDCRFESFPNNALYASNTNGEVHSHRCRFWNNGVANGRINRGSFTECISGFDYADTDLKNADAPDHAAEGLAVEEKHHGSGPVHIEDCTVIMRSVAKCGGGIDIRSGHCNHVKNTTVHIADEAHWGNERAPDIINDGQLDRVVGCTLRGDARAGTSVLNHGSGIDVTGTSWHYPGGRRRSKGSVAWQ